MDVKKLKVRIMPWPDDVYPQSRFSASPPAALVSSDTEPPEETTKQPLESIILDVSTEA